MFEKLGLTHSELGKSLLFTRITLQMSSSVLTIKDRDLIQRNTKCIVLAERISNLNRTKKMESFLEKNDDECETVIGAKLEFLMIHTDCAGQEKMAFLLCTQETAR